VSTRFTSGGSAETDQGAFYTEGTTSLVRGLRGAGNFLIFLSQRKQQEVGWWRTFLLGKYASSLAILASSSYIVAGWPGCR